MGGVLKKKKKKKALAFTPSYVTPVSLEGQNNTLQSVVPEDTAKCSTPLSLIRGTATKIDGKEHNNNNNNNTMVKPSTNPI